MREFRYYIKNIEKPSPDAIIMEIGDIRGAPVFDFKPGQFVMIKYRNLRGQLEQKHTFSIASSPLEKSFIRLGIRTGGKFTQGLNELKKGAEIFVQGPYGSFVFDEIKHSNLVLLAGGIGITPFLSILSYATDRQLSNEFSLIYSNRSLANCLFVDEIKELENRNKHIQSLFSVTGEKLLKTNGCLINKRIDKETINNFVGQTPGKTFFICGPIPFIAAMKANLASLGVRKTQIVTEGFSMIDNLFWPNLKNITLTTSVSAAMILVSLNLINNPKVSSVSATKKFFDPVALVAMNQAVEDRLLKISNAKSLAQADLIQKKLAQSTMSSTTVLILNKTPISKVATPVKIPANTPISQPTTIPKIVSPITNTAPQPIVQPAQTSQITTPVQQPATQPISQPAPMPTTGVS